MPTVFVISDLHLGGRPDPVVAAGATGTRINHSYAHLASFIHWLASVEAAKGPVELVLNGDIVDFLLPDDANGGAPAPWTSDEGEVIRRLNAIVAGARDGEQDNPFEALTRFCMTEGCSLVLLLGNHDLELSLPGVRRHLVENILGGGRISFVYDNEAYCRGDLLIEHGNRYDVFNQVDHDGLRRERSVLSRGGGGSLTLRPDDRFTPPAGSMLVTELFNPIKEKYRFLDLLKPEDDAVLPLLVALEPRAAGIAARILEFGKRAAAARWKSTTTSGFIAADPNRMLDLAGLMQRKFGPSVVGQFSFPRQIGVGDLWKDIQRLKGSISSWLSNLNDTALAGVADIYVKNAMAGLAKDKTFDLTVERSDYLEAARSLVASGRFSTVVFGHTHLPKQISIPRANGGPALYLNTGTWADVMRVPPEVVGSGAEVEAALEGFLQDLAANRFHRRRYLTYARIDLTGTGSGERVAAASIKSYCGPANPAAAPLTAADEAPGPV